VHPVERLRARVGEHERMRATEPRTGMPLNDVDHQHRAVGQATPSFAMKFFVSSHSAMSLPAPDRPMSGDAGGRGAAKGSRGVSRGGVSLRPVHNFLLAYHFAVRAFNSMHLVALALVRG
jgi:hypothetical protein